jgi:7,8-dihydropterin-6-yl-methyl-4-(beta-D-ribofuranosyl)aminobenzene 5'-phosphate synthase
VAVLKVAASLRPVSYDELMCTETSAAGSVAASLTDEQAAAAAAEVIRLEPVDSVVVTTLMDNFTDIFMPDAGPARRGRARGVPARPAPMTEGGQVPDGLIAEHGFSALVTISKAGREHTFLFDAGTSPDGVAENLRRLQLDPASIEAIVCSHGHFDHTTGIDGLSRVLGRTNLPVLIHPHFWRRRRIVLPGRDPLELPTTSRRGLTEAGFAIVEDRQPSFLFGNSVLITGEVPRVSGYEPGFPPQQAWLEGGWQPDPLVLDDQALIVSVAGQGLVVLTGCGHAGVVNIARYASALTGGLPLHALIGGFHLNGPVFEPLIPRVLDDLAGLQPDWLVPAHCTGWRAQHAMSARFGEVYVPSSVGTSFHFPQGAGLSGLPAA